MCWIVQLPWECHFNDSVTLKPGSPEIMFWSLTYGILHCSLDPLVQSHGNDVQTISICICCFFFLNVSVSWWGQWLQLIQAQLLIAKRDTTVKIEWGFISIIVWASGENPAPQINNSLGRRGCRGMWDHGCWVVKRGQAAGLGCRKPGFDSKMNEKFWLVSWDSVLSSPHSVPFQKPGCFVLLMRWKWGLALHSGKQDFLLLPLIIQCWQ